MNYQGIQKCSLVNGEGCRTVLWVSGCDHHCNGCHNPETWNPDSGKFFGLDMIDIVLSCVSLPYIDGLTLSGGDPMYLDNREVITELAKQVKEKTNKSIWMYTGYSFEEIKDEPALNYIDVVVDGEYNKELHDDNYMWAGSSNQKIWRKIDNVWKVS